MTNTEMTRYKVLGKLPKIRNKYIKAILVTKENKEELEKRFPAVALLSNPSCAYVVLKNPNQPISKQEFMFVPKKQFEMNAKEVDKFTNFPIFKNVSKEEGDKLKAKYGPIVIDNSEEYLTMNKTKMTIAEVEETIKQIKRLESNLSEVKNVLDEVMSNIDEPTGYYASKTWIRTNGYSCYVDSNMLKDAVVNEASNLESEIAKLKESIGVE